MQEIKELLQGVVTTLSTRQSIQPSKLSVSLPRQIFDKAMAYLEASKQENFSPETLETWYDQFCRAEWTPDILRDRVTAVLRSTTYGKVKIDDFFQTERLYTGEEVNQIWEQKLRDRVWLINHLKIDEEQATKIAETNIHDLYARKLEQEVARRMQQRIKRIVIARKWYGLQSIESQLEILREAEKRGLIEVDPIIEQYRTRPYIVELILPLIEDRMKRMPTGFPTVGRATTATGGA